MLHSSEMGFTLRAISPPLTFNLFTFVTISESMTTVQWQSTAANNQQLITSIKDCSQNLTTGHLQATMSKLLTYCRVLCAQVNAASYSYQKVK